MKSSCLSYSNHAHSIQKILPIITPSFYEKYTEMYFSENIVMKQK